jgi:WD40 repeat protein
VIPGGDPGAGGGLASAPDGSWVAVAGHHTVEIRDAASGHIIADVPAYRPDGHARDDEITALAVAPVGNWLAVAGGTTIRILDCSTWSVTNVPEDRHHDRIRAIAATHDRIRAIAATSDGRRLASVGDDRFVRVTETDLWTTSAVLELNAEPTTCAWSDCNGVATLTVGGPAGLYRFSYET